MKKQNNVSVKSTKEKKNSNLLKNQKSKKDKEIIKQIEEKKKIWFIHKIILSVLALVSLIWASYYSFVIWAFNREIEIKSHLLLSKDLYINSNMKDNLVIYKSENDLSKYKLLSKSCKIESKFVSKKDDFYIFHFKFLDEKCINPYLHLETEKWIIASSYFDINIIDDFSLLNKLTDYKSEDLKNMKKDLVAKIEKYNDDSKKSFSWITNIDFLQRNRLYKEDIYQKDKINYILEWRKQTYLIPVDWYNLPKNDRTWRNQIPNAGRPYRADTTDGIHHGWDVVAPLYTPVRALADGMVIRVINNFKFEDLKKLKTWSGLSFDDKMKNLDIFRWNQIWIKTMKWDIVFYSHLDSIDPKIKVWTFVQAGLSMWKIWITWVPDKNYKNYHLHFEIAINPKDTQKIWNYNFDDMINWNYLWKWMWWKEIFAMQDKMFKK